MKGIKLSINLRQLNKFSVAEIEDNVAKIATTKSQFIKAMIIAAVVLAIVIFFVVKSFK
jgi:hypothetical protein